MSIPEQLLTVPRSVINQDALDSYLARQSTAPSRSMPQTQPPATSVVDVVSIAAITTAAAVPPSSASSAAAASRSSLVPLTAGGWALARTAVRSECHDGGGCMEGVARRIGRGCCEAGFHSGPRGEVRVSLVVFYEQRIRQCHSRRKKIIRMIGQRMGQGHALQDMFADLNVTGKSLDRMRKDLEKGVNLFSNV